MTALLVALGAAVGAPARHLLDRLVRRHRASVVPWGTLVANAIGSLLLGALAGLAAASDLDERLWALLATGFCGALTTFSTFSLDTVRLVEDRRHAVALLNVVANVGLTVLLCAGGYAAVRVLVG